MLVIDIRRPTKVRTGVVTSDEARILETPHCDTIEPSVFSTAVFKSKLLRCQSLVTKVILAFAEELP